MNHLDEPIGNWPRLKLLVRSLHLWLWYSRHKLCELFVFRSSTSQSSTSHSLKYNLNSSPRADRILPHSNYCYSLTPPETLLSTLGYYRLRNTGLRVLIAATKHRVRLPRNSTPRPTPLGPVREAGPPPDRAAAARPRGAAVTGRATWREPSPAILPVGVPRGL